MTDVLHLVRASVLIFQGISADFLSFSLIAQPTTTIPPLQTRPTPLHTMHASVFVSGPSSGSVFQPAPPSLSLTLSVHYKYVPPRQDRRLCIPCTRRFSSLDLPRARCSNRLPQVVLDSSTHYKYTPSQTWPTPLHIMHASVLVSGPPYDSRVRSSEPAAPLSFRSSSAPNPHRTNLNARAPGPRWRGRDAVRTMT